LACNALLTVEPGAVSQHVAGLGITLLATSLSLRLPREGFLKVDTPPTITPLRLVAWLDDTGVSILAANS
jgi:simple sugar transport system permease protein